MSVVRGALRTAVVATVAATALGALAPLPARAATHDDYSTGIALLSAGRYDEARQAFERAIGAKPQSSSRHDYFPYYELGIAWQGAGSCRRALDAWGEEERQGEIAKGKQGADLHARQQGCKQLLAQMDQLAGRIEQEASAALPLVAQLEAKASAARTAEARGTLSRSGLVPGTLRAELQQMGAQAHAAANDEGRQKLQDLEARLTALRRDVPATIEAMGAADARAGERAVAERHAAETRAAKRAAAAAPAAASKPPAALVTAVNAFLRGDAPATLQAVDGFQAASPLAAAHACLLRAAALHAQALATAGGGAPQLDAARQALTGCAWREQGLQLSPRIFSPRFAVFAQAIR